MKKLLIAALSALLLLAAVSGCGIVKLNSAFDEDTVRQTAKDVARHIVEGDWSYAEGMFNSTMAMSFPEGQLELAVSPSLEGLGGFVDFGECRVMGSNVNGVTNALAGVTVNCENGKTTFMVSFDLNMQIAGINVEEK